MFEFAAFANVTPEMLEAIAQTSGAAVAEEIARCANIILPEPLTFDCSIEEFRRRVLPEVERRLS